MGDFSKKVDAFLDAFINQNGYAKVLEGLQNTLLIAVLGLVIGILIGAMLPFLFSALTINAVSKAANAMIIEVRRQFKEITGVTPKAYTGQQAEDVLYR